MPRPLLLGFAAAALPILSVAAAPATPEEAGRLSALFDRYVGAPAAGEAPRETVTPKGDDYSVTVDLKRSLAALDALGLDLAPYTVTMTLTPRPDGTWRVRSDDAAPLSARFGDQTIALSAQASRFDGIFDPALRSFSTFRQDQTDSTTARSAPTAEQTSTSKAVVLSGTGTAADGGTVTTAAGIAGTDLHGEVAFRPAPPPPGGPAAPPSSGGTTLTYSAPSTRTDLGVDRLDAGKVLDLWAFLAAHPSRDSLAASQDGLKALLRAGLPYLAAFKQAFTITSPAISTPAGTVTARTIGLTLEASGLAGTGQAGVALTAADLVVPPGQLPAWSAGLVPTVLDIHVGIDGIHADAAARAAVDAVDLHQSVIIMPAQKEQVGHVFLPDGGTVTLQPSRIATGMLDLTLQGHAGLGAQPAGEFTVRAKGLDKEIAALQALAATDPGASQVLGPLVLAKNLAKPAADGALEWIIAFGHGPVTINGAALQ